MQNSVPGYAEPSVLFKESYNIGNYLITESKQRPVLATILCVWKILSGSNNRIYMHHTFSQVGKKKKFSWGWSEPTDRNVELTPQFFLELIITQLRFHMVSPQLVLLKKNKINPPPQKKKCITAPILKLTYYQKPETFFYFLA